MKRHVALALVALLALGWPSSAAAYLKFTVEIRGRAVTLKWSDGPIPYFVTDAPGGGLSAAQLQAAVARASATWQVVPTATVSLDFAGFTTAQPFEDDGRSTLGFLAMPEMERVLGATAFVIDGLTGEIVESDVFFNAAFDWSVAPAGESGRFDLESTALHEIGHFIGLGHSAIGETELRPGGGRRVLASGAVMFPISFGAGAIADRTLQPDDIAGASDVYPGPGFRDETGSVQGHVRLNGRPVFGAHVVAFDPGTGALVGGFSVGDEGRFVISGLRPGPKVLRVEPLDDADVESFFEEDTPVNADFRPRFFDRLVIVPRRGAAPSVDIQVQPK